MRAADIPASIMRPKATLSLAVLGPMVQIIFVSSVAGFGTWKYVPNFSWSKNCFECAFVSCCSQRPDPVQRVLLLPMLVALVPLLILLVEMEGSDDDDEEEDCGGVATDKVVVDFRFLASLTVNDNHPFAKGGENKK